MLFHYSLTNESAGEDIIKKNEIIFNISLETKK